MAIPGKLPFILMALISLSACAHRPGDDQLNAWHQEAIAQNNRLLKANATPPEHAQWQVAIHGQVKYPNRLDWQTLIQISTTRITTKDSTLVNPDILFNYRGVLVSKLLNRAEPQADTITFVASDAYRATVPLKDLQKYPILLATERDGKSMTRTDGGPIKLVFPVSQYPELNKYGGVAWVFYVADLIVGTESPRLNVGQKILRAPDLDRIPATTIETSVSYRIGWKSGSLPLQGIRLRDVLKATQTPLPKDGWVTIRGKSPIHRDPRKPHRLPAQVVRSCDVIIARAWGERAQPITAHMGGPLTLAFAPNCGAIAKTFPWVTYVESLEVSPS